MSRVISYLFSFSFLSPYDSKEGKKERKPNPGDKDGLGYTWYHRYSSTVRIMVDSFGGLGCGGGEGRGGG